jgi:hypothetical protein
LRPALPDSSVLWASLRDLLISQPQRRNRSRDSAPGQQVPSLSHHLETIWDELAFKGLRGQAEEAPSLAEEAPAERNPFRRGSQGLGVGNVGETLGERLRTTFDDLESVEPQLPADGAEESGAFRASLDEAEGQVGPKKAEGGGETASTGTDVDDRGPMRKEGQSCRRVEEQPFGGGLELLESGQVDALRPFEEEGEVGFEA